jgi:molecular chaperone HscB
MTQNYFAVFNLAPSFDLDLAALEKSYFTAQRQFHPDRMVGKDAAQRQQSILQSMLVNEAYDALKSPLSRAQHLLALQNIFVGSEKDSVKPSHELLMNIMESREALSEATTVKTIEALEADNSKHKTAIIAELSAAFTASDYLQAAQLTIELGYLLKLDDEIRIKKKGLAAA